MTNSVRLTHDQQGISNFCKNVGHPCCSALILGNIHQSGVSEYSGKWGEGQYFSLVDDKDVILGLAAHYWNGCLVIASWPTLKIDTLLNRLERSITRVEGPLESVHSLRSKLVHVAIKDKSSFSLRLKSLPSPLNRPHEAFKPNINDLEELTKIRHKFIREAGGNEDLESVRQYMESLLTLGTIRILRKEDKIVAMLTMNASSPDAVLIGSMYVPPENRQCGYAKALICSVLQELKETCVDVVALYTDNPVAEKLYRSVGFAPLETISIMCI